jgi:hypothetical protein
VPRRCGHCGRDGTIEPVGPIAYDRRTRELGQSAHGEEFTTVWALQVERCSVCRGLILSTFTYVDGWQDPADIDYRPLYPETMDVTDLPERVRQRFQATLELLHAPDAFAVRAGRVIEAVCADQGVVRGTLDDRLRLLVSERAVPAALVDQAHLVRRYRNVGGHDDDIEVEAEDVPLLRDFVEALLEFFYWGPAKLARGREALERRRSAARASE